MGASGKILVFVDLPDGELDETGRGMLSYAARLAGTLGASWSAAVAVMPDREQLAVFGAYGTPEVVCMEGGAALLDTPTLLGKHLAQLARDESATVVLLPHNDLGATIAPIVAHVLDGAIMTELVAVRKSADGVRLSRKTLGVRIAETRVWDSSRPLIATIPPRTLSQVIMATVRPSSPSLIAWCPAAPVSAVMATIISRIPPDPQTVDLTEAEVIFSAGKGCDPTTFEQLKELCRELNVSFGVTRPVYDLGWTGFERMVGQTGRTVTPRLYVALGISGSMHHIGGIKDSRRIIAVNSDAKAPIFPNVDEGFVGDLKELLPRLLKQVKAGTGGAP
ncbi:MAG: electron transfer flavoprotein subunit alpha/FixB family protein [Desulfuromonadaceae bacterium]|nr:electron transfer flavoprotein subunit alpha/FixB family protein [Desulfuromonadaceae bacterium]MDD5104962.1 electron transfer flavoprotein subunit alpha/FixB family protein [Desulfuromonadaceae bacterium]